MDWWPGRSSVSRVLPAREAYDEWAPAYPPNAHNPLMRAEEHAVVQRLRGGSLKRVLDAGAGTGRYTRILRAIGARTIISLDWSREMLARQVGGAPRVCGDARRLPFADRAFDLVNASLMAGDIANLPGWLSELARVLSPGGRLIYSDFHPAWHERGWRRTFTDRLGRTVTLPCHPHSRDAHHEALAQAGLRIEGIDEVAVTPQLNRLNRWRPSARTPVPSLLIVSAMRTAGAQP